jgi:hypothetical protein
MLQAGKSQVRFPIMSRNADNLNAIDGTIFKKNVGASTSHNPMGLHSLLQE